MRISSSRILPRLIAAGLMLSLATVASGQSAGGDQNAASPLSFKIGSATFTPGGFADFTAVWRSTDTGGGIGTSFGSIPLPDTPQAALSEFRLSEQNSRLSLQVDSQVGDETVRGYVEMDFLGNAANNLYVTSNSNTLRMRLYWVDVKGGFWEVLAGQSWSLLTPNRAGLSPMPSGVFYSQDMDTNYQVGLVWSRDPQLRIVGHLSRQWTLGLSLENSEQYITSAVTLPSTTSSLPFDVSGSGTGTPNLHPDIVAKLAYATKIGAHAIHGEIAGVERTFRVLTTATNAATTIVGGGGEADANLEIASGFHLILNGFYSDGGGRYIYGLGPDLVVNANNQPSLVHAASTVDGFEYQVNPGWMLYGYYGGAYFQNNFSAVPGTGGSVSYVGFGYPGGASTANRLLNEGTLGIIRTFWKEARYGDLKLITQYSYLARVPWSVAAGTPSYAKANMAWVDLRYDLP